MKISNKFVIVATLAVLAFSQASFAQEAAPVAAENAIDYSIQPSIGSDDAPAKVMLFEDFSCSHCATFTEEIFPQLKEEFLENGQAEFFFINNQFLGPNSIMAGMAGECAYEQDEALFWDYKTILFRAQNRINYDAQTLAGLVTSIPGLDATAISTCINDRRHMATLTADLEMAKALGVTSTPTIFVNGKMVVVEYTTRDPGEALQQLREGIAADIRAAVEMAPPVAPMAPLAPMPSETGESDTTEGSGQ